MNICHYFIRDWLLLKNRPLLCLPETITVFYQNYAKKIRCSWLQHFCSAVFKRIHDYLCFTGVNSIAFYKICSLRKLLIVFECYDAEEYLPRSSLMPLLQGILFMVIKRKHYLQKNRLLSL